MKIDAEGLDCVTRILNLFNCAAEEAGLDALQCAQKLGWTTEEFRKHIISCTLLALSVFTSSESYPEADA